MGASLTHGEQKIRGYCELCDERQNWPAKGLGRAAAFAWLTRHDNHAATPRPHEPEPETSGEA